MIFDDDYCEIIFIPIDEKKTTFSLLFIPKVRINLDK